MPVERWHALLGCDATTSCEARAITLTVERTGDHSSIVVQAGNPALISIVLRGPPTLFPSLELLDRLPARSEYTEAIVRSDSRSVDIIDRIGLCDDAPM